MTTSCLKIIKLRDFEMNLTVQILYYICSLLIAEILDLILKFDKIPFTILKAL